MLKLQVVDSPNQSAKLTIFPLSIGGDPSNHLVIKDPRSSDFHCEINADDKGLFIVDLLSNSGTFVNENRVNGTQYIEPWDRIRIGSTEMEVQDPNSCRPGSWVLRMESDLLSNQFHPLKSKTLIGRDPECDLSIDWHLLSRKHAEIHILEDAIRIVDLDSRNGTFLNGVRIKDAFASPGDEIRFDEQRFIVVGPQSLAQESAADDDMTGLRENVSHLAATLGTSPQKDNTAQTAIIPEAAAAAANLAPTRPASLIAYDVNNKPHAQALAKSPTTIGRAPINDLVIDDPSASKIHAKLYCVDGHWLIRDNNSRNGLSVNGEVKSESILNDGDQIQIANSKIVFATNEAAADDTSLV